MPGISRNCRRTSSTSWESRPRDGVDGERAKQERSRAADEKPDEDSRLHQAEVGGRQPRVGHEALKEGHGGNHGGRDGEAFGQRLGRVARRIELGNHTVARHGLGRGPVAACVLRAGRAGHLEDALGVVRDRPERVHRQDVAGRRQQPQAGQGNAVGRQQGAAAEQQHDGEQGGDDHGRAPGSALQAQGEPGQDQGGRPGLRGVRDLAHGPLVRAGEVLGLLADDEGQEDADHGGGG